MCGGDSRKVRKGSMDEAMKQDSNIKRRKTRQIMVGKVPVGGDAPIAVQSMTNTETTDVAATVAQIRRLEAV